MENTTFVLTPEDCARIRVALFASADWHANNGSYGASEYHRQLAESFLTLDRKIDGSREYATVSITR